MKNPTVLVFVVVLFMAVGALAAPSCAARSIVAVAADASTHDGNGGSGGQGQGGQGQGGQGSGGQGAGGGTGGAGGTPFTCGTESCAVGESYCKIVKILVLEVGDRTLALPDRECVPFPVTCVERTACSCFQPPASLCNGLDQSCNVTDSGRVTLTCTAAG